MLAVKESDLKEQILSNSISKVPKMGKFIETESRFRAVQGREMVLQVKVFAHKSGRLSLSHKLSGYSGPIIYKPRIPSKVGDTEKRVS